MIKGLDLTTFAKELYVLYTQVESFLYSYRSSLVLGIFFLVESCQSLLGNPCIGLANQSKS